MPVEPAERFRFGEEVLRVSGAHARRRFLATLAAAAAVVVATYALALRRQGAGLGTLAFSLGLLLALAALTFVRRMRRMHARWASFEVALDASGVERRVGGAPPLRIERGELAAVEEGARGIAVRDRAGRALLVPRELDGYDRLRSALLGWAPPQGAR